MAQDGVTEECVEPEHVRAVTDGAACKVRLRDGQHRFHFRACAQRRSRALEIVTEPYPSFPPQVQRARYFLRTEERVQVT